MFLIDDYSRPANKLPFDRGAAVFAFLLPFRARHENLRSSTSTRPVSTCFKAGAGALPRVIVVTNSHRAMTVIQSFALVVFFVICSSASAQVVPIAVPSQIDPTGRSGEPPPLPKQFEAPAQPRRHSQDCAPLSARSELLAARYFRLKTWPKSPIPIRTGNSHRRIWRRFEWP